jgi:hypothetical protein
MRLTARTWIALASICALPAVALAAGTSARVLVPSCAGAQYKPHKLTLSCDGSNYLGQLTWSTWTRKRSMGTGIDHVNDCQPDCASGHFTGYPVTVTLSRPGTCPHLRLKAFRHILLTYGAQHPGSGRTDSGPLACPL